jgi:hypothetical protein
VSLRVATVSLVKEYAETQSNRGLPAGSPEPRSNISANIRAMKKLGTALERARRAAFKSVEGQR